MVKPRRIIERLTDFNQGREPERLALKYRAMSKSALAFLRGTCHLFYEDWPGDSDLNNTPAGWICGDLHLENFGSFKGDNRLVYFDLNDFDEAALAPAAFDLARLLTSVLLAGESLNLDANPLRDLCLHFLNAYIAELTTGKARWIERSTAQGMIRDLLKNLKKRSRRELIARRTEKTDGGRRLRIDHEHALKADGPAQEKIRRLFSQFAKQQETPEFFQVIDVARRIAGVGSLGVERYVILVNGKGGSDGHYLLDLKHQPGTCLRPYLTLPQPEWENEAHRVVELQRRGQAIAPAFLAAVSLEGRSYVLRELLPTQDRLRLELWDGKLSRLETVLVAMGRLVAWSHLRGSGRQGSAIADEWIDFGHSEEWRQPLLDYARSYAQQVRKDWKDFKECLEDGQLAR